MDEISMRVFTFYCKNSLFGAMCISARNAVLLIIYMGNAYACLFV